MKIDIAEVKRPVRKIRYEVGRTFYYHDELFLIIKTLNGFGLLNLKLNLIVSEALSLDNLSSGVGVENDRPIDVKIVEA